MPWLASQYQNGTLQANSQLVPAPMSNQFYPSMASAPFFKGSGQPPATVPLSMASSGAGGTDQQAVIAASDPFNPISSPTLWAVGALIIGILGLRYVHWRG